MEYTSELAVIRAGNTRIQSPLGASAWQAIKGVVKKFFFTTRFWLPLFFYVLILVSLAITQLYIPNFPIASANNIFYTTAIALSFIMSIFFMVMTTPFLFKGITTYEKPISEQIGITSYWGLIIGKYIGMTILYLLFSFWLSLFTFSIDASFKLGSDLMFIFGKSLQILVFTSLFGITWGSILISISVYFLQPWQASTFIVGLFTFSFAFIPLQLMTHDAPETVSVVVMDENENVTRKEVISYKQANESYNSVYWLVAPFNPLAATASLLNVFDGNLTSNFEAPTYIEELLAPTQNVKVGDIYYNPLDYSTIYSETGTNEWETLSLADEFGREEIVTETQNYKIINSDGYDFAMYVMDEASNKTSIYNDVISLANGVEALIDKDSYLDYYNSYINEDFNNGTNGSYKQEGNSFIIPNEFKDGKYLSFTEFVYTYSRDNGTDIELNQIFKDIEQAKESLLNNLNLHSSDVDDWSYLFDLIVVDHDIPTTPVTSDEEAQYRSDAHNLGNVGVMNQTLYSTTTAPFVADWVYILGLLGISLIFFLAAAPTIMGRNYF